MVIRVVWGGIRQCQCPGLEKAEMQGSGRLAQETQPRAGGGLRRIEGMHRSVEEDRQEPGVGKEQVLTKFCGRKWREIREKLVKK